MENPDALWGTSKHGARLSRLLGISPRTIVTIDSPEYTRNGGRVNENAVGERNSHERQMGLVPWHENYDYVSFLPEAGLELQQVEYFRFAKKGPVLFQSIVATRSS